MFDTKKYTKNNKEAFKVFDEIKDNLSAEQKEAIKKALEDAKYTICEGTYANQDDEGQVLGHLIGSYVNGASDRTNDEHLVQYLAMTEHRYLQGELFKIVLHYIKTIAEMPDMLFDGRNEFMGRIAKDIVTNAPTYFEYTDAYIPEWVKERR